MAAFKTAPVKWAQRKDFLYVTITLPDVKDEKLNLKEDMLEFSGSSNGDQFQANLKFFKPVTAEDSIMNVRPGSVVMKIMKKDQDEEEFWPRLLEDKKIEKGQVTIDWDKYVDEDDDQDIDMSGMDGGQDMASMMGGGGGGMGGMGGMGGGMGGMGGGMGGMGGGMPGMGAPPGGPGGAGGMDPAMMQQMMAQMGMGGAGGAGGPGGGMDPAMLQQMMAGMGGGAGGDVEEEDSDDDEDLPDLEPSA